MKETDPWNSWNDGWESNGTKDSWYDNTEKDGWLEASGTDRWSKWAQDEWYGSWHSNGFSSDTRNGAEDWESSGNCKEKADAYTSNLKDAACIEIVSDSDDDLQLMTFSDQFNPFRLVGV